MKTINLIQTELIRIRDLLKKRKLSYLQSLSESPIKYEYNIFGKEYPLMVWSEKDSQGNLYIIVELTRRLWFGSFQRYSEGFKFKEDKFINLTPEELWEFD